MNSRNDLREYFLLKNISKGTYHQASQLSLVLNFKLKRPGAVCKGRISHTGEFGFIFGLKSRGA